MELVAGEFTPADRVDVRGFTVHPLIILVVPAIEVDAEEPMHHSLHGGHTDEPGLHQVHSLQLHAHLEAMVGAVLDGRRKQLPSWPVLGLSRHPGRQGAAGRME